jgi:autotransporter-associated beta strand protein
LYVCHHRLVFHGPEHGHRPARWRQPGDRGRHTAWRHRLCRPVCLPRRCHAGKSDAEEFQGAGRRGSWRGRRRRPGGRRGHFRPAGGQLIIESGTLGAGTVSGGAGESGKTQTAGAAFGTAIFLQGAQTQTFAPASGTTLTIAGSIDDENGSKSGYGADTAGLVIDGAGTVDLTGTGSDFTGGTTLEAGTLIVASGTLGTNHVTFAGNLAKTLEFTYTPKALGSRAPQPLGSGISDFTQLDTIELLGFAEASYTESNNAVTLVNAALTADVVNIPTAYLLVTSDGTNTTLHDLITTITSTVTNQVTLNNGTYAPNLSITNTGVIISSSGSGLSAAGATTVNNAGSINGGAKAIYAESGAFSLTVLPGAVISGAVDDKAGTGDLTLAGSTAGFLNIDSFAGFSTISLAKSAHWTLQAGTDQLAAGETIAGFGAGEELVLENSSATSASYIAGTGLVLSNGETLNVSTPTLFAPNSGVNLYTTSNGTNTTFQARISTISTTIGYQVNLNNGVFAANISVAPTGKVVTGQYFGIYAYSAATIQNSGVIDAAIIGIMLQNGGSVTNTGLIASGRYGIQDLNAPVTVTNTGTINGDISGMALQDGGVVTNSGTIDGSRYAILIGSYGDFTLNVLPVLLGIYLGEVLIGTALACDPRGDLQSPCAFAVTLTDPLSPAEMKILRITRYGDGAVLPIHHQQAA